MSSLPKMTGQDARQNASDPVGIYCLWNGDERTFRTRVALLGYGVRDVAVDSCDVARAVDLPSASSLLLRSAFGEPLEPLKTTQFLQFLHYAQLVAICG